jgi:hypothetical protein
LPKTSSSSFSRKFFVRCLVWVQRVPRLVPLCGSKPKRACVQKKKKRFVKKMDLK